MENYLSNTKGLMDNMNNSMNNNRERIEYLESVKKELEGTIEVKHQQGEQVIIYSFRAFLPVLPFFALHKEPFTLNFNYICELSMP